MQQVTLSADEEDANLPQARRVLCPNALFWCEVFQTFPQDSALAPVLGISLAVLPSRIVSKLETFTAQREYKEQP